jgi:hypothetical protein
MMAGIFKWPERSPAVDTSGLGSTVIAMPLPPGCAVPPECGAVLVDRGGRTRRPADGARLAPDPGETVWAFHSGPYHANLAPFAAAPEIGLRVAFAIDSPDPRAAQQRFDLYLASEAVGAVPVAGFRDAIEAALRHELVQGHLDLPPCTTLGEWNAFRAGFNQLLYMRFGVTVEECVPADLGEAVDFARILMARTEAAPAPAGAIALAAAPQPLSDARALRRLFLELPCVMCGLRLAVLPSGPGLFRRHQELLQRLDLASLSVATMPTLELAAPGVPLEARQQARRIGHSQGAVSALDDAWALLARLQAGGDGQPAVLFDEAERIVANLEYHIGERRLALPESGPA